MYNLGVLTSYSLIKKKKKSGGGAKRSKIGCSYLYGYKKLINLFLMRFSLMNSLGIFCSEKCKVLLYNYNSRTEKGQRWKEFCNFDFFFQFSCNFSKFTCFYKCSTVWVIGGLSKKNFYVSYFKKWLKKGFQIGYYFLGLKLCAPKSFESGL